VGAQDGLETLTRSRAYGVRWAAVRTLDRLGRGTKRNWETAYVLDLDSPRCEVRRTAVEKLGAIGTRRTVSALREARAEDEKTGGWFRSRCLGDRLDDAEQKILARRS
jgi:HEAT repeat protein